MNDDQFAPAFKLLLSYDMQEDAGQEYYQFVLGRYIPLMRSLGWDMIEAWETSYGNGPDRMVAFINRSSGDWHDLLGSDTWHEMNHQLLNYVTDFSYKVVPYRQTFQI